jgi:hypothetical protein
MACQKPCDGPMNVYGYERGNVEEGRKEGRKEGALEHSMMCLISQWYWSNVKHSCVSKERLGTL